MIKSLTVTNYLGESKKIELDNPASSGFIIKSIDGLGPCKSDINTTEVATNDGSLFNSARTASRNIVINIDFRTFLSIEEGRHETYKYFPNKKQCKIEIETDKRICETYGYVESNEPDIFSKEESTQISIVCPDPYFYSTKKNTTIFSGIEPLFEFPFSNESNEESLIEFSSINHYTTQTVYYDGDAEIGMQIKIHLLGETKNITIYNVETRERMFIDTDKIEAMIENTLEAGDEIIINTVKGNKFITLFKDGEYINILNILDKNTDWFTLSKGDNIFAYTAEIGEENLQFSIENQVIYLGV